MEGEGEKEKRTVSPYVLIVAIRTSPSSSLSIHGSRTETAPALTASS